MRAPRGRWHLQTSRLKGSNFTDNVYCCKNFHLANLALQDHKTAGPFTTSPVFVFSGDFNLCSSSWPVLVMNGQFFLSVFISLAKSRLQILCQVLWLTILWHLFLHMHRWVHSLEQETVVTLPSVSVHGSLSGIVFSCFFFPIGTTLGCTISLKFSQHTQTESSQSWENNVIQAMWQLASAGVVRSKLVSLRLTGSAFLKACRPTKTKHLLRS